MDNNTPIPLTKGTCWRDAKGREWEIFEKCPFGRHFCRTTDRRFQGEWSSREIREALSAASETP